MLTQHAQYTYSIKINMLLDAARKLGKIHILLNNPKLFIHALQSLEKGLHDGSGKPSVKKLKKLVLHSVSLVVTGKKPGKISSIRFPSLSFIPNMFGKKPKPPIGQAEVERAQEYVFIITMASRLTIDGQRADRLLLEDPARFEAAYNYYIEHIENNIQAEQSPAAIAHTALLGVMNAFVTGGYHPIVQIDWGNQFTVPVFNPYDGGSGGGASIDQSNRYGSDWPDYRGFEFEELITCIENGRFGAELIDDLKQHNIHVVGHPDSEKEKKNAQVAAASSPPP